MDTFQKLQLWYSKQCDGSWEHDHGVSIDTLDNPGWTVVVDLAGTDLESMHFEPVVEEQDEGNWLHCKIENAKFLGYGGPLKLEAIVQVFVDLIAAEQ